MPTLPPRAVTPETEGAAHRESSPPAPVRAGHLVVAAFLWSVIMVAASAAWMADLLAHPFSDRDLLLVGAVFNGMPPAVGIGATATVGLVGTVTALALRRRIVLGAAAHRGRGWVAVGWGLAAFAGLVLVHGRLLSFLGYAPLVLTRGWFDAELRTAFFSQMDADLGLLILAAVGALLWVATAISAGRAARSACRSCGRAEGWTCDDDITLRQRSLRIGRRATAVAVAAALVYPALRLPWAFGFGIGMDAASWTELQATPGVVATGIALGVAGLAGAVLMLGLVQDWGVRFPRWIVGLRGRRVPPMLAIVPASIVAIALIAAGRGWLVASATDRVPVFLEGAGLQLVAMLSLLPWGLALAVATGAYALRRRAGCNACGRGLPENLPGAGHTAGVAPAH